jgi:GntR family transcriptional regulator
MSSLLVKDPVYLQLTQALRSLIQEERLVVGSRFFTERQIGVRFGVSRATANKALSSLVAEGVLEFKKGVGTFVRGRTLDYDLQSLMSFTGKARTASKVPTTRVLQFQSLRAEAIDPAVAGLLTVDPHEAVYWMERLRLADGVPVILERRCVVARHCPGLKADELAASLYELWTDRYGLEIAGADQTIHAVNLCGDDARLLDVEEGAAGFEVTSVGYLRAQEPLWRERTLYRGDAYEFHNHLGPIQDAGPATGSLR